MNTENFKNEYLIMAKEKAEEQQKLFLRFSSISSEF